NTGWTGGSEGKGGERFAIPVTRAIIAAIQNNAIESAEKTRLPILNLDVPTSLEGVDALEPPRLGLPWLLEESVNSALIFGPESRGLSNVELNYAQRFVCIPSNPEYPALNLAQAVAVCCYELYQIGQQKLSKLQDSVSHPLAPTPQSIDAAPLEMLEGYYQHLETLLLEIGYLYPHTAPARLEKLRRLFNRAHPTTAEVAMLRGILHQMKWALKFLPKPIVDDVSEQK
ncbi:MAG: phosphoenolpyruvate carboxykinase (ATP), partial [Symploca sp. SIO1A3]|nr:phosphoenolpyruvate carboxykinase (ATP) [Symploca sp. SIO1A3]